jgi:hypothetical protein
LATGDKVRGWLLLGQALTRARLGEHTQATGELKMPASWHWAGESTWRLALVYSAASACVPHESALASEYRKTAIQLLQKAASTGWFRSPPGRRALQDRDLAPLHDEPAFQRLLSP